MTMGTDQGISDTRATPGRAVDRVRLEAGGIVRTAGPGRAEILWDGSPASVGLSGPGFRDVVGADRVMLGGLVECHEPLTQLVMVLVSAPPLAALSRR